MLHFVKLPLSVQIFCGMGLTYRLKAKGLKKTARFSLSACPLANASVKTAGRVEIVGPLARFGEWNFHLQEINKTLNCHRLIFLTKYNLKIPLLFRILKASHIRKFPKSLTCASSLSNKYIKYLLNVKMLLVVTTILQNS